MDAIISFSDIQSALEALYREAKEVVRWIEDWDTVRKTPMERLSWSWTVSGQGSRVVLHVETNYPTDFAKVLQDYAIE